MAPRSSFKGDFSKLNKFAKGLSDSHVVRVGIFGDKTSRSSGGITNAELGAIHEFGVISKKIPARSFLRMPLAFKAQQIVKMASVGAAKLLENGRMIQVLDNLGRACHEIIIDAFKTSGFGNWARNKTARARRKLTSKGVRATKRNIAKDLPLIDTGQLQRSIFWKVVSK